MIEIILWWIVAMLFMVMLFFFGVIIYYQFQVIKLHGLGEQVKILNDQLLSVRNQLKEILKEIKLE